ncbi:MAG: NADH:flavin oxidoreductase/NADH oxidase [Planctomycetes bacterium]|jgi:2,4-dienoyl-CoA reductase-like NADH-dependent reductase (Old Yellow Enzyme family)|nr:NADH:flavin oxidoreductase/NADH oxidase [Planctomycetota bacterium]
MVGLFEPLTIRSVTFRNRIALSPMCMYMAPEGRPGPWHLVHLGARAAGGAGLVMVEATAVAPEGRISPRDVCLFSDDHVDAWRGITRFIEEWGAVPGIQLAHAGRKACAPPPDEGEPLPDRPPPFTPLAPSAIAFAGSSPVPRALDRDEIGALPGVFAKAAWRAVRAGFRVAELHMAHGYLLHEFLSPLSNRREDEYGGSLENRMRLPVLVARAVREVWPRGWPLFARISATDWVDGGFTPEEAVALARELGGAGVDLVDCSSGGSTADAPIPFGPGYQVVFAEKVRREAGVRTAAVGLVTTPAQADGIIREERADLVMLGRQLLREPSFPLRAAAELGVEGPWPVPYLRAAPPRP